MPATQRRPGRAVVLATGACTRATIPGLAGAVPSSITTRRPVTLARLGRVIDGVAQFPGS
jgi:hypothetical protein